MRAAIPDIGRWLVRRSVQRLSESRERCAVCGRTPLVGERVAVHAGGAIVCPLCHGRHRGRAERVEVVRHSELGRAVKPAAPIAA